jgi:hypothetical protein
MQKYLGRDGIAYEGERSGCWRDQAYVSPGERKEQTEKRDRHRRHADDKVRVPQCPPDYDSQARLPAKLSDIAHFFHRPGKQHIANHGSNDDRENCAPSVNRSHDFALIVPLSIAQLDLRFPRSTCSCRVALPDASS